MTLDYVHSDRVARYPALAGELIARKCDVIFALGADTAARALRDARTTIPVVFFAHAYDPVQKGIVSRKGRPGGNITGVYAPVAELTAKRLEIAQDILPAAKRFLVLSDAQTRDELAALRKAAEAQRVSLTVVEFGAPRPYDLAGAFESVGRDQAHAVMVLASPVFAARRGELSALALRHGRALFAPTSMASAPGILASYNQDLAQLYRIGAAMGVRILRGGRAGDIPVQRADEFELVVNLQTAKALGIAVPGSVLSRATKVIG